jgi:protein-disulfide isomerase
MNKLVCVVALLAACTRQESKLDKVTAEVPKPAAVAPGEPPPGDPGDRLARVERRLEKVISILEGALPPAEPDPSKTYAVPVDAIDPVEGPKDAKVTIVEAFEFLCPYCFMVNPAIDAVVAKYPKDVRVVGKYMVIHGQPAIGPAMIACAAAKQGKYTAVKTALWNTIFKMEGNQPRVQNDQLAVDNLKKVAVAAGADAAKLEAELAGCQQWIQQSQAGLRPLGVNATPSFFVNGRFVRGDALDAAVQEAIARADKAIADGVPQDEYYQREIIAKGLTKAKGRFED